MRRSRLNLAVVTAIATLGLLALAVPAQATLTTFAFEGVVDEVIDWEYIVYPHLVAPGDTLSGTCTLDLSVPDTEDPDWPDSAEYHGAVVGLQGQVGDLEFSLETPVTSLVRISNDAPPLNWTYPGPWDEYVQGADVNVLGHSLLFGMTLADYTGMALDSEAIPSVMPPLESFKPKPIGDPDHPPPFHLAGTFRVFGHLTSIHTVPEPSTLLCFSIGGLVLFVQHRRVR